MVIFRIFGNRIDSTKVGAISTPVAIYRECMKFHDDQ